MGRDAYVHISKKITKKSVEELLLMFGYKRYGQGFFCGNDKEYKYFSGVNVWFVESDQPGEYVLRVRTLIYSSEYDVHMQNETIRGLKRYCNAWFESDYGKNRYFEVGDLIKGVQNGCYFAIQRLDNNFSLLLHALSKYPEDQASDKILLEFGMSTPEVFNANVYLSFLCSIIEEYFRETYIALLRYSNKKEKILNTKLSSFDLIDVSSGKKTVEEVFASSLSFQNIHKIVFHFKGLDSRLDIGTPLKKPYHQRKQTLYEKIDEIFERRHRMIHRIEFDLKYSSKELTADINDVKISLERVYKYICKRYDWEPQDICI